MPLPVFADKLYVMLRTIIFDEQNKPNKQEKQQLADFLHDQLEQYGDPKNQIERAIAYSLKECDSLTTIPPMRSFICSNMTAVRCIVFMIGEIMCISPIAGVM